MTHAATLTNDALATLNSARSLPLMAALSVKFAACVTTWVTRRRTRLHLKDLDAWMLKDVGITPGAAREESRKVFWRA